MKILVATREGQGLRKGDFSFPAEGDQVYMTYVCDRDRREGPDGGCGCGRSLTSVVSLNGTTTVKVVERDVSFDDLVNAAADAQVKGEWFETRREVLDKDPTLVLRMLRIVAEAARHPVGTVLEFRADAFGVRSAVS